ncbi:MAG: sugar phosphate isomerase/epimerase, partial [Rhodoferax sp.]|nr:sugar phosphate isomerase/epimerase [Rhodoferax sp.]
DDYQLLPLPVVAVRARRSTLWLSEKVLRRSPPLPEWVGRQVPIGV